jgi:hypothetical protein
LKITYVYEIGVPAYYIYLQYSGPQNFNFSASSKGSVNFTIPACTLYNGVKYVPCHGCNISSYTNYNVTYSCFDVMQLCPISDESGGRRLISDHISDIEQGNGLDTYEEDEGEGEEIVHHDGFYHKSSYTGRYLRVSRGGPDSGGLDDDGIHLKYIYIYIYTYI